MPIYEFHCEKCNRDSELLVRSTDWKGTKCPHCGSARLEKKLSVFASTASDTAGGACGLGESASCAVPSGGGCGCCCAGGKHHH